MTNPIRIVQEDDTIYTWVDGSGLDTTCFSHYISAVKPYGTWNQKSKWWAIPVHRKHDFSEKMSSVRHLILDSTDIAKEIKYPPVTQQIKAYTQAPDDDAYATIDEVNAFLSEPSCDSIMSMVIASHKAICDAKGMGTDEAYGHDPAMYYTLALCGESGEMANAIIKTLRNGVDKKAILEAVKSELPDVIIYSYILAHVLKIDLTSLVKEKVDVVIQRAKDGYYGGKL